MLYSIECPDEATGDNDIPNTNNKVINKLRSGSETDELLHNMDLSDESGDIPDDLFTPRASQPTCKATIAARSKMKLWLDSDNILLRSDADHARNYVAFIYIT